MEEMKPMGEEGAGVIIRAFLTFPSDIMGRKEGRKRRGAKVAGNGGRKGGNDKGGWLTSTKQPMESQLAGRWGLRVNGEVFQYATSFHLLVRM